MAKKKISFEEGLEEIDKIIEVLESKGESIENSIKHYERAMSLIGECEKILNSAEAKVEKIISKNENVSKEDLEIE